MKKVKLKQGTLAWEKARATRIGSSEVFDIVRYYATDDELQNCGINAERFMEEKPYTTAWSLYHKILNDGIYQKAALEPEFAEYGHAVEPYGVYKLNQSRQKQVKPGEVYADDKLIVSLDVSGVAEEIDCCANLAYGTGKIKVGQKFACEQKSMFPIMVKNGLPFKYIIQAQYQILKTKLDFFIIQLMVLDEDTPFIRGKICQMSKKKRFEYLDEHMSVQLLYFQNNEQLARLIQTCLDRFFEDVKNKNEPTPFITEDKQANIIASIRLNSAFDEKAVIDIELQDYFAAKRESELAEETRKNILQRIIEIAKKENRCKFQSSDKKFTGAFDKAGRFSVKEVGGSKS